MLDLKRGLNPRARLLLFFGSAIALAGCSCPSFPGARGRVLDQSGKPIAGAAVSADEGRAGVTSTDPQGTFALPTSDFVYGGNEACRPHQVDVSAQGCSFVGDAPKDGFDGDYVLACCPPSARSVRGRLLDQDGKPVEERLYLTVDVYPSSIAALAAGASDSSGAFLLGAPTDLKQWPNTLCGAERVVLDKSYTTSKCDAWSAVVPKGAGTFDLGDVSLICKK
jgi:hypothetical protein